MSDYETTVRAVDVSRNTNDTNRRYEVGDITEIRVEVSRSEIGRGAGFTYRRTIHYRVRDGIAEVHSITPTNPKRNGENGEFYPRHIVPLVAKADSMVRESVPEVEAVRALADSLRNHRSKQETDHPHATTEEWENPEQEQEQEQETAG